MTNVNDEEKRNEPRRKLYNIVQAAVKEIRRKKGS